MRVSLWFHWITVDKYGEKNQEFNPECVQKMVKYPASVMVWRCFLYTGMGCMKFIEKTLKSDDFQQVLKDGLLHAIEEHSNAIFQQD